MQEEQMSISKKAYEGLQDYAKKANARCADLEQDNAILKHELEQLKRMVFGRKSERFISQDDRQLALALEGVNEQESSEEKQEVTYERKKKKAGKAKRLILPANLPREQEIIEPDYLPTGSKKIGEQCSEVLEYTPGKIYVRQIIRPKYVVPVSQKQEESTIITAELPNNLPIPQSNIGAGLLSHLLVSKFIDHLPFYRQVQQFKRQGIVLPESTISGWFKKGCQLIEPLYDLYEELVLQSDYLQIDESPINVQNSSKKGATHTGYMWVYRSPIKGLVLFKYHRSREGIHPAHTLGSYKGVIQTDAYSAYEQFENNPNITTLGCLAHVRRKFEHALENDKERAEYALTQIRELYLIEREAIDLTITEKHVVRQEQSVPIVEKLEQWMIKNYAEVLPKSPIGKALAYGLGVWKRICRYTQDGRWEIDNNGIENKIRPLALGRKNYLFAGSHDAAQRIAMMYSLFACCKEHDVEPLKWMKFLLENINETTINQLNILLPQNFYKM